MNQDKFLNVTVQIMQYGTEILELQQKNPKLFDFFIYKYYSEYPLKVKNNCKSVEKMIDNL